MKKIDRVLKNGVIVKATGEPTKEQLEQEEKNEPISLPITKVEVFQVGKDVEDVKIGDQVIIYRNLLNDRNVDISPFLTESEEERKKERHNMYIILKEEDILAVIK